MNRLFSFVGGSAGAWRIVTQRTIAGERLADANRVEIVNGLLADPSAGAKWTLRGVTSHERYVARLEKEQLLAKQPIIGRPEATSAALIPIRKSAAWWALAQDERRKIFEESSRHIATGLKVLPAVARRLHHCRDLGTDEPFDFLTWFEYAPDDASAFEEMVGELRATEEWRYVDREVDIRLSRDDG